MTKHPAALLAAFFLLAALAQTASAFTTTDTATVTCSCYGSALASNPVTCANGCAFNLTVPTGATAGFIQQMNYGYYVVAQKTQSGGQDPNNINESGIFDQDNLITGNNQVWVGTNTAATSGTSGTWSLPLTNADGFNNTNCPTFASGYCTWYVRVNATASCRNRNCEVNTTVWNETYTWSWSDTQPPRYSNIAQNNSSPNENESVIFSVRWTDNVNLSSYIFEWNATGVLTNDTAVGMSGSANYSNVTKTLPPGSANKTIVWKIYANDTSNNWNATGQQSFAVRPIPTPFVRTSQATYSMCNLLYYRFNLYDQNGAAVDSSATVSLLDSNGAQQSQNSGISSGGALNGYFNIPAAGWGEWLLAVLADGTMYNLPVLVGTGNTNYYRTDITFSPNKARYRSAESFTVWTTVWNLQGNGVPSLWPAKLVLKVDSTTLASGVMDYGNGTYSYLLSAGSLSTNAQHAFTAVASNGINATNSRAFYVVP